MVFQCVINRTHKIDKTLEILTIDFWLHSHSYSQFEHFNCSAFIFYAFGAGIRKQAHIEWWKNTMNSSTSRSWNLLVKMFWNCADFNFTKPPSDWLKCCCCWSFGVYFRYWFYQFEHTAQQPLRCIIFNSYFYTHLILLASSTFYGVMVVGSKRGCEVSMHAWKFFSSL